MPNRVLAERISHERELREAQLAAFDHEREIRAVWDQHERELRLQAEAAVEKARQLQFEIYEQRLESMNQYRAQLTSQAATFLPMDRFEREHTLLVERMERGFANVADKLAVEERISTRAAAQDELLAKIGSNNRWMVGILVTLGIFGATTLLHVFGVI